MWEGEGEGGLDDLFFIFDLEGGGKWEIGKRSGGAAKKWVYYYIYSLLLYFDLGLDECGGTMGDMVGD